MPGRHDPIPSQWLVLLFLRLIFFLFQEDMLKAQVDQQPLIGEPENFDKLAESFAQNPKFTKKIVVFADIENDKQRSFNVLFPQELRSRYSSIIHIRGDGNCFYRSYIFGCLVRYVLICYCKSVIFLLKVLASREPSILATLTENISLSKV